MGLSVVEVILGVLFLYFGATFLIHGSVHIAKHFRIKPFLIGITVVAFSTSMPEVVTTAAAQIKSDSGNLALGNILGSNIANIGLILGLSCLIRPITPLKINKFRDMPILFLTCLVLGGLFFKGTITRLDGFFLLLGFIVVLGYQVFSKKNKEKTEHRKISGYDIFSLIFGFVLLILGAELLVRGSIEISRFAGISDRVIGLSLVAIGTSLPELAASCVAAYKKHEEISLGNVVGSNIFNALFVLSIAAMIRPIHVSSGFFHKDLPALVFFTIVLWAMSFSKLTRIKGGVLLALYTAYIVSIF